MTQLAKAVNTLGGLAVMVAVITFLWRTTADLALPVRLAQLRQKGKGAVYG